MKKSLLFGIVLTSVVGAGLAHADGYGHRRWHDGGECDECGGDDFFQFLASMYTLSTLAGGEDDRAVYIQNVQDDAAAYLAGNGESALLSEAIKNLRIGKGATGTDAEIAAELVRETN